MAKCLTVFVDEVEILGLNQPSHYQYKDKNGNVIREGDTYSLRVNTPDYCGDLRCSKEIYDSVEIRSFYDFVARIYENTKLSTFKLESFKE